MRKVVRRMDFGTKRIYYESLRPFFYGNNGDWERRGRKYDLKGLDNLVKGTNIEFIFESLEIEEELERYRKIRESRKQSHQKQFKTH